MRSLLLLAFAACGGAVDAPDVTKPLTIAPPAMHEIAGPAHGCVLADRVVACNAAGDFDVLRDGGRVECFGGKCQPGEPCTDGVSDGVCR